MKVSTLKKYREGSEKQLLKKLVIEDLSYIMDRKLHMAIKLLKDLETKHSGKCDNLQLNIHSEVEYYGEAYLYIELIGDRLENEDEFKRRTQKEWHFLKESHNLDIYIMRNYIRNILFDSGDDLRDKKYREELPPAGYCYIASEAFYHLMGGKKHGWKPMFIKHEGESHWFVKRDDGLIMDITDDQFGKPPQYEEAQGKGFLTKEPSKRTRILIERMLRNIVAKVGYW